MINAQRYGDVTQFIMGRLIDGRPVYTMASYYIDGLLIDTGPVHVADEIEAAFADFPVELIVNTHHHEDHIGNNMVFQQKRGVQNIFAHPLAVPLIETPGLWTGRLRSYQHFAWGDPPPSIVLPLEAVIKTKRYAFQIIHTPGHSPDHICLLEPQQGWLFAGDVFVREKVPTLRSDENVTDMLASLHKLLQYEFSTLYCSSGTVVSNAKAALERKIAYWEELGEKVIKLYEEGIEPEEIRERLLGKETVLYEPTEGDFGKINLINSFIQGLITNQPDSAEERQ